MATPGQQNQLWSGTIPTTMTIYIFNSPVLTNYGDFRFEGALSTHQARELLVNGFISAIGHQASAELLTQHLNIKIPINRISVTMQTGDQALVLRLLQRLPEGKILTTEQMQNADFELALLTKLT